MANASSQSQSEDNNVGSETGVRSLLPILMDGREDGTIGTLILKFKHGGGPQFLPEIQEAFKEKNSFHIEIFLRYMIGSATNVHF